MARKDLYEYQREIRSILLAAHADRWVMNAIAEGALREAEVTLANAEGCCKCGSIAPEHNPFDMRCPDDEDEARLNREENASCP